MQNVTNFSIRAASSAALMLLFILRVTAQEPLLTKVGRITVHYDKPDAVAGAIRDAAFDWVQTEIPPQDIPPGGKGQATYEVYEIDFGRLVFADDLPAELRKRNLDFADPLTAIVYATTFPNRQRMHPLNILFTDKQGKPCYLLLGGGPDRRLRTMRAEERGHWGQGARFIVIRKRASGKKSAVKRLQSLKSTPISSADLDLR
jgi:hypothetical protein